MKIHSIKTGKAVRLAGSPKTHFEKFLDDLRKLSDHYGFKIVSLGALSGTDSGEKGTTYLAIWMTTSP